LHALHEVKAHPSVVVGPLGKGHLGSFEPSFVSCRGLWRDLPHGNVCGAAMDSQQAQKPRGMGFTAVRAWAKMPSMRPVDPIPAVVYLAKRKDIQICIITCWTARLI
jgi:hypothetical protein